MNRNIDGKINNETLTRYIKHLAVSGLTNISARIKSSCNLIGNRFEMPNVSYTHPLATILKTNTNVKMTEIKLTKTPLKAIRIFLLSIPFVAIGIWMVISKEVFTLDWIMGLLCSGFFSLGLFVGLFHFFDKRPQIIINEIGIWDRTTKQDLIKWEFIKKAYPISIYRQRFISLVVDKNFEFKTKQYKWATKLSEGIGAQKLNIQISQIKIEENRFTDFINTMIKVDKVDRTMIIKEYFE